MKSTSIGKRLIAESSISARWTVAVISTTSDSLRVFQQNWRPATWSRSCIFVFDMKPQDLRKRLAAFAVAVENYSRPLLSKIDEHLAACGLAPEPDGKKLIAASEELVAILTASVRTARGPR